MMAFALRNQKELLRDKLNILFGLGFPLVLLSLLTLIQSNVPVELFRLQNLPPGICVFGLSFISLFSGTLIARDRGRSFLPRLYCSPMRPGDYILGYALPLLPLAAAQMLCCFAFSLCLGLSFTPRIFLAILVELPAAVVYIALGLLCGSLLRDKQVGGVCGALLTNVGAWLGGTWFDLELLGGTLHKIAMLLPFAPAVEAGRAAMEGDIPRILPHVAVVGLWAAILLLLGIAAFRRQMKRA